MAPLFRELFGRDAIPRNVAAAQDLERIAARYDRSLPQLALRWTTANPVVSTSLVGCRTVGEVQSNVGALGWRIDDADLAEIDEIFTRHGVNTCPDSWIEEC
jgi:aryl-alcohol dehydrogenase-like predicted oxidoreductase